VIGDELPTLGVIKPMALLARECSCDKQQAIRYGERLAIKALYEQLAEAQAA
jgi:hypothetical protein